MELVPFPRALEEISIQVYGDGAVMAGSTAYERVDGLACTVSVLAPILAREKAGEFRRLSEYELASGTFREGGSVLAFRDGRPPVMGLHLARPSIDHVVELLRGVALDV